MNDVMDSWALRTDAVTAGAVAELSPSTRQVQGVVLAGSHSWGDCVVKEVVSQLQLPIAGRSLLGHMLDWFTAVGTTTTTLCANSRTRNLFRWFGDHWGHRMDLHYLEDRMPRGPAGCIRDAASCQDADLFIVVEGGVLPLISLPTLLEAHYRAGAELTVVVARRSSSRGAVDEPGGIYVFSRKALAYVPPRGYQDIKEMLIPKLHAAGARIGCYEVSSGQLPRIKGAASYLAVNAWMLERTIGDADRWGGYEVRGESRIHRTAVIGEGAELIGPVLVGPGTRLGRSAMVIGPTTLGRECVIGNDAVISRSAIWDGSCVGDRCVIDQAILTHRAVVASGRQVSEGIGVMPPTRQEAPGAIPAAPYDVEDAVSGIVSEPVVKAPDVSELGGHRDKSLPARPVIDNREQLVVSGTAAVRNEMQERVETDAVWTDR